VEEFFALVFQGTLRWVISEVLEAEILDNPYSEGRSEVLELLASSTERIILTDEAFQRAEVLEKLGHDAFDALHLACAEQAQVDGLLTTDDRFIRRVQRGLGNSTITVENPVNWRRGFTP
jgi:predicted nucleic acid-binding protein